MKNLISIMCLVMSWTLFAAKPPPKNKVFSLGALGAYSTPDIRGDDSQFKGFPYVQAQYYRLGLEATSLGYEYYRGEFLQSKVFLNFEGNGYDSGDSNIVSGMEERDSTVHFGLKLSTGTPPRLGQIGINFSLEHDILSKHKGMVAGLEFGRMFVINPKWLFRPKIELKYFSRKYNDYYYGVRANEVLNNRPSYLGSSSVVTGLGLTQIFPIAENWNVVSLSGIELRSSVVKDSPITSDRAVNVSQILGFSYSFINE